MVHSRVFTYPSVESCVAILGEGMAMILYLKYPMDCFNIHTHSMAGDLSQAIVSVNVNTLPIKNGIRLASVSIHPWYLSEENVDAQWKALQNSMKDPRVIAIGEAGLDKLKGPSTALQISVFRQEIDLSEQLQLPMVIHCVRAFNELIQIRKECLPKQPWIIHGFRGKASIAQELLRHGCWLSFGSKFQEEALRTVPLQRLFIETDESEESIEDIYLRIAQTRGISLLELTEAIKKNVREVFFKG